LKRVLFDHNVPAPLEQFLKRHQIKLADELGWARLKDRELLDSAKRGGFDVLLSGDKTIRHEQNMSGRKIALLICRTIIGLLWRIMCRRSIKQSNRRSPEKSAGILR
jgi:predicted nuclease of predicted toxin-antitoxin system